MSEGSYWEYEAEIPNDGPEYDCMWVTKEGKRIAVKDLEDEHLLNIIKMLKRFTINKHHGGVDGMELKGTIDGPMDLIDLVDEYPIYTALCVEAIERGLIE